MNTTIHLSTDLDPDLRLALEESLRPVNAIPLHRQTSPEPQKSPDPATVIAILNLAISSLGLVLAALAELRQRQQCEVTIRSGSETWTIKNLKKDDIPETVAKLKRAYPDGQLEITVG